MARKEMSSKALWIHQTLEELYPVVEPPLDHFDPYTLMVAVLLSAQCTDKKVNEVTPELFRVAPDPASMLKLGATGILDIIRPLGLAPQKSKHLEANSRILLERFQGKLPRTLEELEQLPGVGHKTASVVLNQAFGVAAFPVDTHIHRLAQRWKLSTGQSVTQTERDLKATFPERLWGKLHLQIIFYGREYCKAVKHPIEECPICLKLQPKTRRRSSSSV